MSVIPNISVSISFVSAYLISILNKILDCKMLSLKTIDQLANSYFSQKRTSQFDLEKAPHQLLSNIS